MLSLDLALSYIENCLVIDLFFNFFVCLFVFFLLVWFFFPCISKMDLSTKFLHCNGQAMQVIAHSCWFSSLAQVLMIKSSMKKSWLKVFMVAVLHCADFRIDIVRDIVRVKSILVVDPGCK